MNLTLAVAWGFMFGFIPVGWSTWITRALADKAEIAGGLSVAAIQFSIGLAAARGGFTFDNLASGHLRGGHCHSDSGRVLSRSASACSVTKKDARSKRAILNEFKKAKASLRTLPERGRIPPELERLNVIDFRENLIGPYRMIYQISLPDNSVQIHMVVDGRRDLPELLEDRLLRMNRAEEIL